MVVTEVIDAMLDELALNSCMAEDDPESRRYCEGLIDGLHVAHRSQYALLDMSGGGSPLFDLTPEQGRKLVLAALEITHADMEAEDGDDD